MRRLWTLVFLCSSAVFGIKGGNRRAERCRRTRSGWSEAPGARSPLPAELKRLSCRCWSHFCALLIYWIIPRVFGCNNPSFIHILILIISSSSFSLFWEVLRGPDTLLVCAARSFPLMDRPLCACSPGGIWQLCTARGGAGMKWHTERITPQFFTQEFHMWVCAFLFYESVTRFLRLKSDPFLEPADPDKATETPATQKVYFYFHCCVFLMLPC